MWLTLANILGGVGLFSVGIHLLSEGFQSAAGQSLRRILSEYTDSTFKGIVSSCFVASLVQSSSAVIVTTIGFINSRLIKLKEAITIVFGANLGKVATIWILATLGFRWDIASYGIYIVGLGAVIQSLFVQRKSGWTLALMGFGLLLFGLFTLKTSISSVNSSFQWDLIAQPGFLGMFLYFLVGAAMSVVMQSSTSAIIITFAALDANILNVENATAMVIGQNLGSISSSILASMGTTPVAKRLSAMHALFNITVTLVSLVLLAGLILFANDVLFIDHKVLAVTVFYSIAIAMSLAILLPLRNILVEFLKRYFVDSLSLGSPKFLKDEKSLTPNAAISALTKEIWHFAKLSTEGLTRSIEWRFKRGWVQSIDLTNEEREMDLLVDDIQWFASKASRKQSDYSEIQPVYYGLTMASRHFENVCDLSKKIAKTKAKFSEKITGEIFAKIMNYTDSLMELTYLLTDVRDVSDGFLFPEIEDVLQHSKEQKASLSQHLMHASSTKEILYSDAMLLLEISDLALQSVEELYSGTKETLNAIKQVPLNIAPENNVIPIKPQLKN